MGGQVSEQGVHPGGRAHPDLRGLVPFLGWQTVLTLAGGGNTKLSSSSASRTTALPAPGMGLRL